MTGLTKIVDGKTDTGTTTAYNIGELRGDPRGSGTFVTIIVDGITTGAVSIEIGATSTGPWEVPADGALTADGVVVTPASDKAWLRANVTDATSIDLDVFAG
jgi:hypothetical protein